jgi:hypothetical protein
MVGRLDDWLKAVADKECITVEPVILSGPVYRFLEKPIRSLKNAASLWTPSIRIVLPVVPSDNSLAVAVISEPLPATFCWGVVALREQPAVRLYEIGERCCRIASSEDLAPDGKQGGRICSLIFAASLKDFLVPVSSISV